MKGLGNSASVVDNIYLTTGLANICPSNQIQNLVQIMLFSYTTKWVQKWVQLRKRLHSALSVARNLLQDLH